MKEHGYTDGTDVYLLVCYAGKEDFADRLADLTKSKVYASEGEVTIINGEWETNRNNFKVYE